MKKLYLIVIVCCFFSVLSSCDSEKSQKSKVKIMFSWTPGPENGFLFYGIDQKIFDSLGIEVNWLPSKGSSIVTVALANSEVDFGFISSDYILISRAKGFPLKSVLTLYHETPVVIYSLKENNIITPLDLKGKNIGVLNKSAAYPQVIGFLASFGLKKDDYKEVFSKGSTQELISNQVDAMMQYSNYGPPEMIAKEKREVNIISLKDSIDMYGTSIAVSEKFLTENPIIVEKFIFGLLLSLERAKNHHGEVLNSLLKGDTRLNKLEMDLALSKTEVMIYNKLSDSLGVGYMTKEGWEKTLNELNKYNSDKINPKIEDAFTTQYLDMYHARKK